MKFIVLKVHMAGGDNLANIQLLLALFVHKIVLTH